MATVYEVRPWSRGEDCLYTDDPRVVEALQGRGELRLTGRYYRSVGAARPFAWDITGPRDAVEGVVTRLRAGRR